MTRLLEYFFIIFVVLNQHNIIHAQTLNPDTLAKYHVSKILTYKLDTSGQRVLQETRMINKLGYTAEHYTIHQSHIDSILLEVRVDSVKYEYDSSNKIIRQYNSGQSISYTNGEKKSANYSSSITNIYKKPLLISPFSQKNILYIYSAKNYTINKKYTGSKCYFYLKYSNDHTYSLEKHNHRYKRYIYNKSTKVNIHVRKKFRILPKKYTAQTKSVFNSMGDISKKNIETKRYYYRPRFKKAQVNSYVQTYQYTYNQSFIISCKNERPDFIYMSKPKKDQTKLSTRYKRHQKRIRFIEEIGTVIEEEFYEYITDPPNSM